MCCPFRLGRLTVHEKKIENIEYNLRLRFPFDWENPIGYGIAVMIEFIITTYICFIMGILISFGIEAILLGITLTKHIRNLLHEFNKGVKSEQLINYVEFHSALKQLSKSLFHVSVYLI